MRAKRGEVSDSRRSLIRTALRRRDEDDCIGEERDRITELLGWYGPVEALLADVDTPKFSSVLVKVNGTEVYRSGGDEQC